MSKETSVLAMSWLRFLCWTSSAGPIPKELGDLSQLRNLYLGHSQLTGNLDLDFRNQILHGLQERAYAL